MMFFTDLSKEFHILVALKKTFFDCMKYNTRRCLNLYGY